MQKFDILSRLLKVRGSHFLEASAGTGKTFAIEHLVVRLLIEGENPPTIDQILVVTFTRAATRELRARIRLNLQKTLHALKTKDVDIDYLSALDERLAVLAIERIEAACICFDQAQIFTVHGFCHRMLSECAFEAKRSFDPVDPDEGAHRKVMERAILHVLREELKLPHYSPVQMAGVLKKHLWKMDRFTRALTRMVNRNKPIAASSSFAHLHEEMVKRMESLGEVDFDLWLEDFARQRPCYYEMKGAVNEEQATLLGRWLAQRTCSLEEFDRFLSYEELFLDKMRPEKVMKKAKVPEADELHYPGLIEQLQKEFLPLWREAQDPGRTFLRIAQDCRLACQSALEQAEKLSPDALLEKMRDSLNFPPFVSRVREKYRAAIIDEFQDTDPIQWEIFKTLFLSSAETLCLVGDPKQSIYAFRSADVYTYLNAASALGEKSRAYLDTNFRSQSSLVQAFNRLFSTQEGEGWMRLPRKERALCVPSVKAHRQEGSPFSDARGSIHFFAAEGSATFQTKRWPQEALFQEKYFPFIAREIAALKNAQALPWEAFALLVSDRYQARRLVQFLKEQGIPVSVRRSASLLESPAYPALYELLEAVLYPHDLGKLKRLLAGPLIGWTAEEVYGSLEKEPLLQAKAIVLELHEIFSKQGFSPFFQACIQKMRIEEILLGAHALPLYTDLKQLAEILIEQELARHLSARGVLSFLDELQELDPEEESWLKVRTSEEKGSVAILTTHMSKGLEFEIVFALGMVVRQGPKEQIALQREEEIRLEILDPSDPACKKAMEEGDAEKLRQFYVALTRAKQRVYVPLAINTGHQEILKPGHASPCELFLAHLLHPTFKHEELYAAIRQMNDEQIASLLEPMSKEASITYEKIEQSLEPSKIASPSLFPHLIEPPSFTLSTKPEFLYSFSALAKKSEGKEFALQEPSLFPTPHTLPLGAETGVVFHALIEKVIRRRLHHPLQQEAIRALIQSELKSHLLKEWSSVFYQMVIAALTTPLQHFSLSDVPPSQILEEMEFAYPTDEGMMRGFIDLAFVYEDKYYLLDWKTNYLGPTDKEYHREALISCMQKNDYPLQASIYATALRRYVKLFDTRPFEECFGGAFYFFVRGNACLRQEVSC